jgi:hypothetical protein
MADANAPARLHLIHHQPLARRDRLQHHLPGLLGLKLQAPTRALGSGLGLGELGRRLAAQALFGRRHSGGGLLVTPGRKRLRLRAQRGLELLLAPFGSGALLRKPSLQR